MLKEMTSKVGDIVPEQKLSQIEGEEREQVLDYIRSRWSQLSSASRDARKDATKFIAVINAGGAATILAFLGATIKESQKTPSPDSLRTVLLFFVLGIILSGFSHAATNLRISGLFARWRKDVMRLYDDQIGFQAMRQADMERAQEADPAAFCIWGALIAFIVGAVLGLALFS